MSRSPRFAALALAALAALVAGAVAASLFFGATPHRAADVWSALTGGAAPERTRIVVLDVRLPRAVAAALVGVALGGSGAVLQAVTLNPLAGPGILGLNGGGALAVLALITLVPSSGLIALAGASLAGSAASALLLFGVTRLLRGGTTALGLTLCGAALGALEGAVAAAIVIASGMQSDMLFWTVGGLGRADWPAVAMLAAGVVPAGIAAAALAPSLTVLLLGDDAAAGLGQRVVRVRRLAVAVIVLAAGAATAVAGPVAFVGLMAPHAARALLGHDQRLVLPAAALVGAGAVLAADVVGRVAAPPAEVPLGVFASLVGAPLLVALVAQRRRAGALA